jgi:hypothetical protein
MLRLALGVLFASVATFAVADELESTHLFGFTLGSDVNAVGEKEAESEATGRFGKGSGHYVAASEAIGVKFIPYQNFSIEPIVSVAAFGISGVPGLDDRRQFTYEATTLEMRYRLFDRDKSGFGLTVGFDPHWARIDDISGPRSSAAVWLAEIEAKVDRGHEKREPYSLPKAGLSTCVGVRRPGLRLCLLQRFHDWHGVASTLDQANYPFGCEHPVYKRIGKC